MPKRRLTEPEVREIIREHVGCIPPDVTCAVLSITRKTYYRVLRRNAGAVLDLQRLADRWAILYPMAFGLRQPPGTPRNKLGHRLGLGQWANP